MNFGIFQNFENTEKKNLKNLITLNFGPQHPAAHGVLRLILQLKNEYIFKIDIHIGLLHRGTEYLIENKKSLLNLGYFDRLDYVSMLSQEHAYCNALEKNLKNKNINFWNLFGRVLFDELTRILNHLLAISCHALDLGSMNSMFWAFEERENIMEFYENISGARMHANFYKPNQNLYEINKNLLINIINFTTSCFKTIQDISCILINNKIWKQRLINIGKYNFKLSKNFSLSGVMLRSVGFKKDIRLFNPYAGYKYIKFNSFYSLNGDCYDRFLLRIFEMIESLNLIIKSSNWLLNNLNNKIFVNNNKKKSMEKVIEDFKNWQIGENFKTLIVNESIESPKGEFGVILFTKQNKSIPVRCKIRSSSIHHLNLLNNLAINHSIADLVTLMGTIDIVFGEIDR